MRGFFYCKLFIIIGFFSHVEAATISYEAKQITATRWEYDYTVKNDGAAGDINQFALYFSPDKYRNLEAKAAPDGWDVVVNQPDTGLPSDGFYDALALDSGISSNASLSGFSVLFDLIGTGKPGGTPFDILDPDTLVAVESGTSAAPASQAPLPGALGLFLFGIGFLARFSTKK